MPQRAGPRESNPLIRHRNQIATLTWADEIFGTGKAPAPTHTKPPVTETGTTQSALFKVTGRGNPSVRFGSDTDTREGGGHLGVLGDGNYLPWSATLPYTDGAMYWDVTAQLEGSGDITASVYLVTTHHYSNGTHKSTTELLKSAYASGGYQIANAEYVPGF